jgi:hypothetical protein
VLKTHHRKAAFALNPANNAIHMIKTNRVPPVMWKTRFFLIFNFLARMKKFIAKKKKPQRTKNWILHHNSYVNPHTCEACYLVPLLLSLHNLVLCFYEQASCRGTSFQASSFCIRDFLLPSSIFKQVCDEFLDQTFCEVCEH